MLVQNLWWADALAHLPLLGESIPIYFLSKKNNSTAIRFCHHTLFRQRQLPR